MNEIEKYLRGLRQTRHQAARTQALREDIQLILETIREVAENGGEVEIRIDYK